MQPTARIEVAACSLVLELCSWASFFSVAVRSSFSAAMRPNAACDMVVLLMVSTIRSRIDFFMLVFLGNKKGQPGYSD